MYQQNDGLKWMLKTSAKVPNRMPNTVLVFPPVPDPVDTFLHQPFQAPDSQVEVVPEIVEEIIDVLQYFVPVGAGNDET